MLSHEKKTEMPLQQLRQIRIDKIKKIRELGINPYPSKLEFIKEPIFDARKKGKGKTASIAGRIISTRSFGELTFLDILDNTGKFQVAVRQENLDPQKWDLFQLINTGDFIEVIGVIFNTKTNELTIDVKDFNLLSKSIRPLPSRRFGLKDKEEIYRQRYVDFILNSELKELFRKKAVFWNTIRSFMKSRDFLEVETPVLENTAGGADANPFTTYHEALDIDVYLRISMGELWQKRLMVGGFEKTFEIGRQFRNEGISREHLQDYTQMEFYWAYASYEDSMDLVKEMYKKVAQEAFGTLEFEIGNHKVNLGNKWERIDYTTEVKNRLDIDVNTASVKELKSKLDSLGVKYSDMDKKGRLIDMLWKYIRKDIAGPVFLIGHPVEISPLAKRSRENEKVVERYQIILAGSEMGNGYSELNDPIDQAMRFSEQQKMRDEGDDEAQMQDKDFVRALEYGMPPVTGFGVSERLFSFLANKSVRECVMFPLLKPEKDIDIVEVKND